MSEGTIALGVFEQLREGCEAIDAKKGFELLRQVIEEIIQESDISLLSLNVRPLPAVPRCRGYMMEDGRPRHYLLAHFRLPSGSERYLLEIDTSDNRKRLSTRVVELDTIIDAKKAIIGMLVAMVKGSLRWPRTMTKCSPHLHSVHHPKVIDTGVDLVKVRSWKQRLRHVLSKWLVSLAGWKITNLLRGTVLIQGEGQLTRLMIFINSHAIIVLCRLQKSMMMS